MSAATATARIQAAAVKHRRDFNPREVMPQCTAWIDDTRAVFGAPLAIRAAEAGKLVVWGELTPGRAVVPVMDDFGRSARKAENAFKRAQAKSGKPPYAGAR